MTAAQNCKPEERRELRWLTQWWQALFRDVIVTGAGLTVIWTQVISATPRDFIVAAGVALTLPSVVTHVAGLLSPGGGQSSPPSSSPGPPSSPPSSPGATREAP